MAWRSLAQPAHALVRARAIDLAHVVEGFDRLRERTAEARSRTVVTHGEPHAANVMCVAGRMVLIDWDTTALAPPERDLWLVASGGDELDHYRDATGHRVELEVMTLYRLRWYLDDVARAVRRFRAPHQVTGDTRHWWEGLNLVMDAVDPWRRELGG
jgi:spectinomycin phosphotransferase